jgi:polysaccharide deacetylase family protein (PEP-CTERM system associated)
MKLDNRLNAMTVDVEDYFQVSAFEDVINKSSWDSQQLRVGKNTHRLLDLFGEHDVKSTFFTLGWVARRCPDVIKRIVDEGHELASHGLEHQRATTMSREAFEKDVYESKAILEDTSGQPIKGYRAPSFSVNDTNTWVYEVLAEQGFVYSSSTYPIEHDLYGVPEWPRFKYERKEGIIEVPIPTLRKKGANVGIGGGGFYRLYPYWLSRKRIVEFMKAESAPYSFYFHPWEVDPDQPYIKDAKWRSKFRHYVNLSRMEAKIEKLLKDFKWGSMYDAYIK